MNFATVTETWARLPDEANVRPPRTQYDYLELIALLDHLTDRLAASHEDVAGSRLEPLFHLASTYVQDYEREHGPPIPDSPPNRLLAYLMEEHGLRQADLASLVDQSLLSKILRGERAISKALARKLGERFGVSPAVFL